MLNLRQLREQRPSPGSGLFATTVERTDNICGVNMTLQFQQVTSNFYSLSKVQEVSTVTGRWYLSTSRKGPTGPGISGSGPRSQILAKIRMLFPLFQNYGPRQRTLKVIRKSSGIRHLHDSGPVGGATCQARHNVYLFDFDANYRTPQEDLYTVLIWRPRGWYSTQDVRQSPNSNHQVHEAILSSIKANSSFSNCDLFVGRRLYSGTITFC